MYALKTDKIRQGLESLVKHEIITIDWNVDSTICVLIKNKNSKGYYQNKLSNEITKKTVDEIVNFLYSELNKEFK